MARQTAGERADLEGAAGVPAVYLEEQEQAEAEQREAEAEAADLEAVAEELPGAGDADQAEAAEDQAAPRPWRYDPPEPRQGPAGWDYDIPPEVARYLKPDEDRAIPVRQHVIRLAGPALAVAGGLLAAIALNGWAYSAGHASPPVVHTIWIAYLIGLGYSAWQYAEWRQTWFVVTGSRIMLIQAKHLFGRDITMLPIPKLRDLAYRQSSIGRFLGYATFDFASIGTEKALDLVPYLPWPEWLYQQISELTMPTDERKLIKRLPR